MKSLPFLAFQPKYDILLVFGTTYCRNNRILRLEQSLHKIFKVRPFKSSEKGLYGSFDVAHSISQVYQKLIDF